MVLIQAFIPGISLGAGGLLTTLLGGSENQRKFRSRLQPPGWLFCVAWALQAVSLGFVGQGIFANTTDVYLHTLFYIFASSLGPLYASSVLLAKYQPYLALYYDMVYVAGLLVLAILIWKRAKSLEIVPPYIVFMLPTIGWISFAALLTVTAWTGATMAKTVMTPQKMELVLSLGRRNYRRF